jgi:hypothetical protein
MITDSVSSRILLLMKMKPSLLLSLKQNMRGFYWVAIARDWLILLFFHAEGKS